MLDKSYKYGYYGCGSWKTSIHMVKINQYYDTVPFSVCEVGFLQKIRVEGEHQDF